MSKYNSKFSEQKNENWKVSSISRKYPTYRNSLVVSVQSWFKGKQKDDEAEGLWRIYDTLYDFTDFVKQHPGGSFWLQQTKGTDITEPFESHHISTMPEKLLDKYKIRKAAEPRNYTLTMHEHGFYKTLKRRVRRKLEKIDYSPKRRSDLIHLGLLVATLTLSMASAITGWILFEMLAALALCWLAIASHNYFHMRDNWRMYTFNFTLMNFNSWRVSHALSHHVYPNSLHDLEMALFEPFLCFIPNIHLGSVLRRIILAILQPIIYMSVYLLQFITRIVHSFQHRNVFYWHDIIGFILPALMLTVTEFTIFATLRQWLFIIALSSFIFTHIGLTSGHHDPEVHHDGDANRLDRDWGIFQIDTVIERSDIIGSQFLILTHFGEHALHHLFPTLDHGILPQLYPVLLQTLQEFKVELRESNHLQNTIGQNQQLLRTEGNPIRPGSSRRK